jgi:hypothetical protein
VEPANQGQAASERTARESGRARGGLALAFAVAAALSCWNPLAAPFAFVAGAGAAVMAGRALRRGGRRVAGAALALGIGAAAASVAVLGLTAGKVGVGLSGEPVIRGRTPAELERVLDDAADRTREERERARHEFDRLGAPDAGPALRSKP